MSSARYPFRFYGREPADWTVSAHGFLYEVQFAAALDEEARAAVRSLAEAHFGRGPAQLGEVWRWGGGRFLVFSVKERFRDAARMVFTHVSELFSALHQSYRLRDVVLGNGVGARADRWDSWSLSRAPEPDAGPARPDAEWASLLRRPVDEALAWDAAPSAKKATKKPAPKELPAPTTSAKAKLALVPLEKSPPSQDRASEGWARIVEHFRGAKLLRVPARVPLGWLVDEHQRPAAVVCLDGVGEPRRIDLPTVGSSIPNLAVDPDGLHAVTHVGSALWSLDLAQGAARWRLAIHANNGPLSAIAWVVDDLWAVRCTSQLMLFDLSEEDALYVGTQQPQGSLLGSVRHGTVLPLQHGSRVTLYGVCDWQVKKLGSLAIGQGAARVQDDELVLGTGRDAARVDVDAVYEKWAASLRRSAEACRVRRFEPKRKGPHWRWVSGSELPADTHHERTKALEKSHGADATVLLGDEGGAVVAVPFAGVPLSRGARLRRCDAKGTARDLASASAAREHGFTGGSVAPGEGHFFYVTGADFSVHRVDLARDASTKCALEGFSTRGGLFFDLAALGPRDFVALWNNSLDWHREGPERWPVRHTLPVSLPRELAFNAASRRIAVSQQSRKRLLVLAVGEDGWAPLASLPDAVKRVSFREGRLFAQMVDGQWFELLGADAPPA